MKKACIIALFFVIFVLLFLFIGSSNSIDGIGFSAFGVHNTMPTMGSESSGSRTYFVVELKGTDIGKDAFEEKYEITDFRFNGERIEYSLEDDDGKYCKMRIRPDNTKQKNKIEFNIKNKKTKVKRHIVVKSGIITAS